MKRALSDRILNMKFMKNDEINDNNDNNNEEKWYSNLI